MGIVILCQYHQGTPQGDQAPFTVASMCPFCRVLDGD